MYIFIRGTGWQSQVIYILIVGAEEQRRDGKRGENRTVYQTLFGPSTSSNYNIFSLIQPSIFELLWTAVKKILEAVLAQKTTPKSREKPSAGRSF